MSSHREAPEISKDPVADSTDLYAFISPDRPDTTTLIANYLPLQNPAGGPNFYPFGDDVLYEIHVDNNGDGRADVTYQFQFTTEVRNENTFLYNTGPIESLDDPDWNSRQFYTVTKVDAWGHKKVIGRHLSCPPDNIGPLSTPSYFKLANAAIHRLDDGSKVFAGQRADGFYVDLGSIFDLLNLRPFQNLNVFAKQQGFEPAPGVNALNHINVKTIALQVPTPSLLKQGRHPSKTDSSAVIGVWTSASRQQVKVFDHDDHRKDTTHGPFVQVSRLGNPLVNEVIIPLKYKDRWNRQQPSDDKQFEMFVQFPEVARLLPVLYPGVFPNLATLAGTPRADLVAILLTGIPGGLIPGFQNFTGPTEADMLRLNTAIPPTTKNPNIYGLLGGDLAGFPNGRRPTDDVVTIELRAIAGVTVPLVDPSFKPDGAAGQITDFSNATGTFDPNLVSSPFLNVFPYLGVPYDGYHNPSV